MKKRYVVAGILAAAGLICGGIAYYQYYQDAHAGQEYEKIKEKVEIIIEAFDGLVLDRNIAEEES